ncbi:hypothetical protein FACS1894147_06560 [Spirochaetia bacterium]|nr:hypothetical protein FACS1894147_06560 [Spirochaetia bacterium]
MKNKRFLGELLAIMLVFGLLLAGCDTGTGGGGGTASPFEGTWNVNDTPFQIIFTGSDWVEKYYGANHRKGIFTYTSTHFHQIGTHVYHTSTSQWVAEPYDYYGVVPYTINGNTLTTGTEVWTRQ